MFSSCKVRPTLPVATGAAAILLIAWPWVVSRRTAKMTSKLAWKRYTQLLNKQQQQVMKGCNGKKWRASTWIINHSVLPCSKAKPAWVPRSSTTPQIQQTQGQSSSRTYHFWLQLCGKGVLKLIVSLLQQYKRTQTDTHQRCQAHAADPDLYVAQTLLEVNRKRLTCNLIHIDYHLIQVGMDWLMTYRLQFIPKIELKFREIVVTWIFTTASLHAGWRCRWNWGLITCHKSCNSSRKLF